jgi:CBS domain-containing protein
MPQRLEGILPARRMLEFDAGLDAMVVADEAPRLAREIHLFLRELAGYDLGGRLLTGLVSSFNDRLTSRVVELTARRHRLPAVPWCWLAFGSEGREEQTFVTDQDNGLVYGAVDEREAQALRRIFLPFAQETNHRLAECGFSLCPGNIMAGNPAWCLSLDEWREQFIDWVRRPDPQALLNATIFFDLRPLHGDSGLAEELVTLLLSQTVESPAFLHLMAANALQAEPPLNFRGEIVSTGDGVVSTVDLKKFGSRVFVDAARIFALATGTRPANTTQRLRAAGPAAGLQPAEIEAMQTAFAQLLHMRLMHQVAEGSATEVWLEHMDDMERGILRESLRQAKRLQQRLKLNYSL